MDTQEDAFAGGAADRAAGLGAATRAAYCAAEHSLGLVEDLTMSDAYGAAPIAVHLEAAAAAARICTRANAAILRHAFAICQYAPEGLDGDRACAGEDLAEALGTSGFTAARLITTARAIYGKLPLTADAFDAGDLPLAKATVLAGELGDAPVQVALAVEEQVIPTAAERTPSP